MATLRDQLALCWLARHPERATANGWVVQHTPDDALTVVDMFLRDLAQVWHGSRIDLWQVLHEAELSEDSSVRLYEERAAQRDAEELRRLAQECGVTREQAVTAGIPLDDPS